ncbi:hypothetical protein ACFSQP_00305 [Bizionia sediminis]|uniref:Uncharacterized protein n=1 Tax=Bizionia sediminis TaxID=1737064 RepID=A0ABW5KRN3_9FLAO
MKYLKFLIPLIVFACSSDKVILLPEVSNAPVHEVLDLSPAYLFYDTTAVNGVELNRRNLIVSTNWLVNVDKRLTLKQAIPEIQFIQFKKRDAGMHKNEAAKNYYSCNDTGIKNLGFIDFTDVFYHTSDSAKATIRARETIKSEHLAAKVDALSRITVSNLEGSLNLEDFIAYLSAQPLPKPTNLVLNLSENLTFQDYITLKAALIETDSTVVTVNPNEFIY